jgi:hypothetical protein
MRRLAIVLACAAGVVASREASAQPPAAAWCPMPSTAPIGGWFWFVPCGWVPSPYPYLYSAAATLPAKAGFSNVWFTVGNYNPYTPRIDVPMPALWASGGNYYYDGCSEALGAFVDWFSLGSFTSYVAAPEALGSPAPAQPVTVGMSGICPM